MNSKRPLVLFCVSVIAGILFCSNIDTSFFYISILLCLLITIIIFKFVRNSIYVLLLSILFYAIGGFLTIHTESQCYGELEQFYGQPAVFEGFIDSEIESSEDGKTSFVLRINKIVLNENERKLDSKLIVNVSEVPNDAYKYRSKVIMFSIVEKPKPATNPGGFNYKRYLASIGISGTVHLQDYSSLELCGDQRGGWLHKLGFGLRNKILGIIQYCLEQNQAGLLSGMLIGYKNGLDQYAFDAFSKAGLTHIMVASGMNVAFIILPFTYLFKKFHIKNTIANSLIILVLILFVFIAGFSASVVRAVIMGIIILSAKLTMRETDIYTSISAAAVVLLLMNPFVLYDIGFQLSFGATLSLVLFYPGLKKNIDKLHLPAIISDTIAATIAAQLGVIPVTLYYFNTFSTISFFTNLLVVPLVQIITIIGFIMVFMGFFNLFFAVLIGYVNNTFLSFVLFVTEFSSKIPYASLKLPTPNGLQLLFYYLALICILKYKTINKYIQKIRSKGLIVASIIMVLVLVQTIKPRPLEVTFLDVGEGDSSFITTAYGTSVLIDGGGRAAGSKSTFDIGESVMVPYILDTGTKKIDFVLATHGHSDHTEGLEAVLEQMDAGVVIMPDTDGAGFENIIGICTRKGIKMLKCKLGDRIRLDKETVLDVLSPLPFEMDTLGKEDRNESSLVLKLVYKNVKILFTGDSGIPVEQRILKQGLDVEADVIKIGHHGSNSSTSQEFIDRVNPEYGVISVGRNSFGHPSQFVTDRLEEAGIRLLQTDNKGAVIVTTYGNEIKVKTMTDT